MRTIEVGARPLPYLTCKLLGRFFPALYWSAVSNLRLREVPEPRLLGGDWVKVRPILSGICASDLAGVTLKHSFDSFMSAFASFPIGLGHEVVGRVVEVGEAGCPSADGQEVSVGDRVNLDPYLHCRIRGIDPPCPSCRRGETATCQNFHEGKLPPGTGTGSNNFTRGTWSDCFLAHRLQLIPVPEGVTDEQAALVDPMACSLHAVTKQFPADTDTVLVYGCGTMGFGIIASLRALGSRARLLAIARYDFQAALARRFGADEVLVGLQTRALFDRVAQLTGGKVYTGFLPTSRMLVGGADIVFDSVGSTETLANAMKFTRPHGTLVVVGIGHPKRLDWTPVWLQEMRILGSLGQGWESWRGERLHTSVLVHRLIQEGRLDPTPMLTHRFDLSDYGRAFATALGKRQSRAVKVAFAFS